jgi:AmiR/NasT family two-component response regulator
MQDEPGLTEQEAHDRLRKRSMDLRRRMVDLAWSIVLARETRPAPRANTDRCGC